MGVHGLSGFISSHSSTLFKRKVLVQEQVLVIDGTNLFYALNAGITRCYGGEYPEMYARFCTFFNNLLPLAKDMFVLMDGRSNLSLKLDTIVKRRQQYVDGLRLLQDPGMKRLHPFPQFSLHVFVQVMKEKRVKFAFCCESEADMVIAAVANLTEGIVVSEDSDFYLCGLTNGLMLVSDLLLVSSSQPYVNVYDVKNLEGMLLLPLELLPALSVFLGNDFVKEDEAWVLREAFSITSTSVTSVSSALRQFQSVEDFVCKLRNACKDISASLLDKAVESLSACYEVVRGRAEGCLILAILEPRVHTDGVAVENCLSCALSLKDYVLAQCRDGTLAPSFLNFFHDRVFINHVAPEDWRATPAQAVSAEIRNFVWALILCKTGSPDSVAISEYGRAGVVFKINQTLLNLSKYSTECFAKDIWTWSASEKNAAFSSLCQCDVNNVVVAVNDQRHLVLPVLALRYWVFSQADNWTPVHATYIRSIVYGMFWLADKLDDRLFASARLDLNFLHCIAQWQSVLQALDMLNGLLGLPLPSLEMNRTFCGKLAGSLVTALGNGKIPNGIVEKAMPIEELIFGGAPENVTKCASGKVLTKKKPKKRKKAPISANRFSALAED